MKLQEAALDSVCPEVITSPYFHFSKSDMKQCYVFVCVFVV